MHLHAEWIVLNPQTAERSFLLGKNRIQEPCLVGEIHLSCRLIDGYGVVLRPPIHIGMDVHLWGYITKIRNRIGWRHPRDRGETKQDRKQ